MKCHWNGKSSFISILDWHAPYRQRKVRNTYAHYIDKDFRHKMFLRDLYKKRFNKSKSLEDWKRFQKLRNAVNREKPKKKREYFSKKLNENRGDIKDTWKTLNMALGKKSKSSTHNSIRVNGEGICNKKKIADELNHQFSTTAKRVLEEFPSSLSGDINLSFEDYITNMPKPSKQFYFKKITPQAVTKAISQLKNSKSGTIPVRFLKDASVVIAYPLSEIFSQSLSTGNLKVARISAIYKGKGSRSNHDNYRPISVLSVVSRLFEKLVHEQLYSYIKDSLSKRQSGFKPGHSTELSLLNTTNKWIINIDKKTLI